LKHNHASSYTSTTAVVLKADVEDFDHAIGSKLVHLGLIALLGPDSIKNSSDDDTSVLDNADKLVDSLRANMALREGTNAGNHIDLAVLEGQWLREVGSVEIAVSTSPASDIEHTGAKVNAIDVLSTKLSQANANKASTAASIEDHERGIIDLGTLNGAL
jgi:hypothetical protein